MKIAAFFGESHKIDLVYGKAQKAELAKHCLFPLPIISLKNFDEHLDVLASVEVIFSTWTMPALQASHLDKMPSLRAVFFAAGSVKRFAEPMLERGIIVVSAWRVNAIPTAEFAFAQIVLAMKGSLRNQREYRQVRKLHAAFCGPGNYDECVALLGCGAVGSRVAGFLKLLDVRVLVHDPFLSDEQAEALSVEPVSLEEAFARGYVVSNHMPHLPETERILTAQHFESMRPDAVFINTARGVIVDEPGMISVLQRRPDLQAVLDVAYPEPPPPESPLYSMQNVFLTAHIAGALNNEVRRLGQCCVLEFLTWCKGRPLKHAVTREIFAGMA